MKIVPDMTYNVFGGTLNPTLLYSVRSSVCKLACLDLTRQEKGEIGRMYGIGLKPITRIIREPI